MCDSLVFDETHKNPDHKKSLLYGIYSLYQKRELCDVQISVNSKKLLAHGVVLASSSDYFDSLIEELPEDGSKLDIPINGIDDDAISKLIEYFYVGELKLQKDTILNIMAAAALFQINALVKVCCKFMLNVLDASNCLAFAEMGQLHECEDLREKAEAYITQNIKTIAQTEEFKKIGIRQLENLLKVNLNVSSENEVFEWVKTWINHDKANRKEHLISLLKIVRLPALSSKTLFDDVQPLCEGDSACQDLIFQALRMIHVSDKTNSPSQYWITPRTPKSTIIITGSLRKETTKFVLIYDPQHDSWKEYLNTGIERWNASYALVGDELFVIGGVNDGFLSDKVETVNLKTGKKTTIASLQQGRYCAVAGTVNGSVYVFGGNNAHTTIDSVEKWDPLNRRWTYENSMITGREGCGIGILNNEIFVVGGWNKEKNVNNYGESAVEAFCTITGNWRACAPLTDKRHWVSAGVASNKLYVVGGREKADFSVGSYKTVEVYDSKANKWSYAPNLLVGRYGGSVGALGPDLVAVGGANNGSDLDVAERLDSIQNKWVPMSPMPQRRENCSMFSVPIDWLKRNVTLH